MNKKNINFKVLFRKKSKRCSLVFFFFFIFMLILEMCLKCEL